VGDAALEDRACCGGLFVHVGVEGVAGEVREVLDVLKGDRAAVREERVTRARMLIEIDPERVPLKLALASAAGHSRTG
jgi:hypothetical protein